MRLAATIAVLLLAGCGSNSSGPSPETAETGELPTIKLPDGIDLGSVGGSMQQAQLPGGFVISHPQGWTVSAEPGRAELRSASGSEFVLIQAVLGGGNARSVLDALTRRGPVGPMQQTQVLATRGSASDTEALLRGQAQAGPTPIPMRGQALVAMRGGAATVFAIGAREESFGGAAAQLVDILKSFRYAGDGQSPSQQQQAPASNLRYRRVEDSKERAYSMELPEGWTVDVAMHREGTDLRPEASARSPQGDILLFFNDRNVGPFAVPTEMLRSFGMGEGATYNPAGRPMLVWRYLPGAEFAKWWLPRKFNGARITGERQQPEIAQQVGAARYRYGNPMGASVNSGEITFEYQGRRGRVHATTEIYGSQELRNWAVIYHHGYIADAASEAIAAEAVAHAVGTTQINLQWLQMERKMQAIDAENLRRTTQEINEMWRQTAAERTASADQRARTVGDLLSGTFRVLDPTTGETGTVQAGSNYYYRVPGTGGVVGTNTDQGNPVDLTPLIRIDWDQPRR